MRREKRGNRRTKAAGAGVATVTLLLAAAALSAGGAQTGPAPAGRAVDPATAGVLTGTVKLEGAPPRLDSSEPADGCWGRSKVLRESIVLGRGGALANVVVYLEGDFSGYAFPTPSEPVTIDQQGCTFRPRVVGVRAGQPLRVTNLDNNAHSVHPIPKNNREWNEVRIPGEPPIVETFARQEVAIPVICNMHPHMQAYIAVLRHPFFSVTRGEGVFSIRGIPPGSYTVTAWHEYYGISRQPLAIGPREQKTLALAFRAPAAAGN